MKEHIKHEYLRWLELATADTDLAEELAAMGSDEAAIEDAFYRNLEFGTGGLRGVTGAGSNRMNIYTVAKASQGLANYVAEHYGEGQRRIAVSFDSRIKSKEFARAAAEVFAANGIEVHIYPELMPTPCLSFAVRALQCSAGIMITASHNPAKYNGYKVYGADGCQITVDAAEKILAYMDALDIFKDVCREGFEKNLIKYIQPEVYTAFIEAVKQQSVLYGEEINRAVSIVYSPLNGTGLKPVLRSLLESGFENVFVVPEQAEPDGQFTTCPYPNPETKEAMALGMKYAKQRQADLFLATDPDCDRVGIAVRNAKGAYEILSGNEIGILLLDFICSQRMKHGLMPDNPVMVKTIVTIDMAERIAADYGVRTVNVLTGFKYIGEQVCLLEQAGRAHEYVFGFEDSYGYLSGSYVRDKDGVGGVLLVCEMFAYYKTRGISLLDKLEELYDKYGYSLNTLHSFSFEGIAGFHKMQQIMANLKKGLAQMGPKKVLKMLDYSKGLEGLPQSDVLKYILEDNSSVVIRPSGTEPKLKAYISVSAQDKGEAELVEKEIVEELQHYFEA